VLAAHEAVSGPVLPVHVSVGLAWEALELAMLGRLLAQPVFKARVLPLERVAFTMRDVYAPTHWAVLGRPPAYDTPDEDVYLTGRNLVLLSKAGVVAASRGVHRIALGPLAGNPFPDARPEFFAVMQQALTLGLDHHIDIATPFIAWQKEEVVQRGQALGVPLELTLSCMNPIAAPAHPGAGPISSEASDGGPLHCGLCSKCRERRDAFAAAGVPDPTAYAHASPR
jgi:7-cyano-7-deazaguanine synthase